MVEAIAKYIKPELLKLPEVASIRPFTAEKPDLAALDQLNVNTPYAHNPVPERGITKELMTSEDIQWWLKGDENHALTAICASRDNKSDTPVGFVYRSRNDPDALIREPYGVYPV